MRLESATLAISTDEPAWMLEELNLPTPDSRGIHRYQIIKVVRERRHFWNSGQQLVDWRNDLGDAKRFTADQFRIMGGFVDERGRGHVFHSVEELRDMADELRNRDKIPDVIAEREPLKEKVFLEGYHDEMDRRRNRRKVLISTPR